MTQSAFLSGKVLKRTLPVVQPPAPPAAPTVKRLPLPQGELAQFFDGEPPIRYIAAIELRRGGVRGNHYHKVKEEWVYVIQGGVTLVVEDIVSKTRDSAPLRAGDLAIIQTGVAHALQTVAPGWAIEFSPARFDPEDIHRYPLVTADGAARVNRQERIKSAQGRVEGYRAG